MNVFEGESIPKLYPQILSAILADGKYVKPRGLGSYELSPVLMVSRNPRKRLFGYPIRKDVPIFSYVEGLWMLLGEDEPDRVAHYAKGIREFVNPETGRLDGAYGPAILTMEHVTKPVKGIRFFGSNQMDEVYRRLNEDPDSRQAIVVINQPYLHKLPTKDYPCTLTWQFLVRDGKLNMIVNMRSQDAWWGLIYDSAEFQWFQEIMAGWLGLDVGTYYHFDGSLHLYDKDVDKENGVEDFLANAPNWDLYSKAEILDARINKIDFNFYLSLLAKWETSCRKNDFGDDNPDFEEWGSRSLDNDFYANLMDIILAYNLRLRKEYKAANEIIQHNKSDLGLIYRNRWLEEWF